MITVKFIKKIGGRSNSHWLAEGKGNFTLNGKKVEYPVQFLFKDTDKGLEVDLSDKENPCKMDGRVLLAFTKGEKYPIDLKPKKGLTVDINKEIISHFNVKN